MKPPRRCQNLSETVWTLLFQHRFIITFGGYLNCPLSSAQKLFEMSGQNWAFWLNIYITFLIRKIYLGLLPGFFWPWGVGVKNFLKCQDFESACYSLSCLTYAMKITYANAFTFCFYGSVCDCCKCFSPQSHMEWKHRLNVESISILGQHTVAKYNLAMRFVLT